MSMIRRMVGVMFVTGCAALALTGCPEEGFDDDCIVDADCADDEICYGDAGEAYEGGECVETCDPEDEDACGEGEFCGERDDGVDGDEHICLPGECSDDADCGDDEICYGEGDSHEANTCVAECDPEDEDPCAEGQFCDERDDDEGDELICVSPPETCTETADCPGISVCFFDDTDDEENDENGQDDNGQDDNDENGDNGQDDNGENGDNGQDDNGDNGQDDNGDNGQDDNDENGDNGQDDNGENGENGQDDEETGVCIHPDDLPDYHTVLIADATSDFGEDNRCTDETYGYNTAGAKIYDVLLLEDNVIVANGIASDYELGEHDEIGTDSHLNDWNSVLPWDVLDGDDPEFAGTCPDIETLERGPLDEEREGEEHDSSFHYDHVWNLGCDGLLFVHFEDEDGEVIELNEDHQIEVFSYGEQCSLEYVEEQGWGEHDDCDDVDTGYCPQSISDPYFVDICTDFTQDGQVDVETCNVPLASDPDDINAPATDTEQFDVVLPH